MQPIKLIRLGTVSALVAVLAACGSTGDKKDSVAASDDTATVVTTAGSGATTSGYDAGSDVSGSVSASGLAPKTTPAIMVSDLSKVYYFDYDSSVIKSESTEGLDLLAEYLKQDRSVSVVLGGHADERGTREYNMALGERRAKSVENYLLLQGVYRTQLETVSYGEEKPVMLGHDEQSWWKNRRVETKF